MLDAAGGVTYSSGSGVEENSYYYYSRSATNLTSMRTSGPNNWIHYNFTSDMLSSVTVKFNEVDTEIASVKEAVQEIAELDTRLAYAESFTKKRVSAALEEIRDFSAELPDWTNTGFTVQGKALSGQAGAVFTSNRFYGIDSRDIRWDFRPGTGAVIDFSTVPNHRTSLPYAGSTFRVDAAAKQICVLSKYTDPKTAQAVKAAKSFDFDIAGQACSIILEKRGRTIRATLYQIGGAGRVSIEYTNQDLKYYEAGCMQGMPECSVATGDVTLTYFNHSANCRSDCLIYILGDSITEGYGIPDNDRYVRELSLAFGADEVCISGIGGEVGAGGLERMKFELESINPKNIIYFLGTNSYSSRAVMEETKSFIESKGAHFFQCSLMKENYSTSWMYGQDIIRLDADTRQDGAVIADYFIDGLHPNAAGSRVIASRMLLDLSNKLSWR